jgi:hypothetical protein
MRVRSRVEVKILLIFVAVSTSFKHGPGNSQPQLLVDNEA